MSRAKSESKITLEGLFTSPNGFGLTTATNVQRAVCRVCDGEPLGSLAKDKDVIAALGTDTIPFKGAPFEIVFLAAIRGAKSKFAACVASRNAMACDMSKATSGDEVRSSVVSVKLDLASPILSHAKGAFLSSKFLRPYMIGDPTNEGFDIRHQNGRLVEFRITSGSKAGSSLVARYSAGCAFDEAARMQGQEDGVVNLDHLREAVVGRLLDGAQLMHISSPWAPMGPVYDMVQEHFGKPTQDLVVIRANGKMLNPYFWTDKRIEALKRRGGNAYKTDYLAEFADLESSLFPADIIARASSRTEMVLPPDNNQEYAAAIDPATRGNAWTLVVVTRKHGKKIVVCAKQWQPQTGQASLNTKETLRDIASICRQYRVDMVRTDQASSDFVRDIAAEFGLSVTCTPWTANNKPVIFGEMEKQFAMNLIELPPDQYMRQDLIGTKKIVSHGGQVKIVFPRTKDKRHGDYAPALALALKQYLEEPPPAGPEPGSAEYIKAAIQKEKLAHIERVKGASEKPWWEGIS